MFLDFFGRLHRLLRPAMPNTSQGPLHLCSTARRTKNLCRPSGMPLASHCLLGLWISLDWMIWRSTSILHPCNIQLIGIEPRHKTSLAMSSSPAASQPSMTEQWLTCQLGIRIRLSDGIRWMFRFPDPGVHKKRRSSWLFTSAS